MTSVIVPVYNGAHILPTTLPALCALEGADEIIVVDDGSTDGTAEMLTRLRGVRTVTMPDNRGRAAARNAGYFAARGDLIVFLDADVEPLLNAVIALTSSAGLTGAIASVARLAPVADSPDEPFQDYVSQHPRGPSSTVRPGERVDWRFFLSGACAIRRDAFEAVKGFPEDVAYGEDLALACRLAARHPDGLRLADTTVRLHDLGTLDQALRNADQFGQAAARFAEPCAGGALDAFHRAGVLGRVAPMAVPVLRSAVATLGPGPMRRRAVRYLLASTALRAARRA